MSFQPTTTTFRFPADWTEVYGTLTMAIEVCGTASFTCTKAMDAGGGGGGGGGGAGVVALAVLEYAESPEALVARTR